MNATQFARRRGRIEHLSSRTHAWRVKALAQLVRESRAVEIITAHRLVGWKLPNGEIVCIKQRYRDEATADRQLVQIDLSDVRAKRPVRSYPCPHCGGWHLTSQVRPHTNKEE